MTSKPTILLAGALALAAPALDAQSSPWLVPANRARIASHALLGGVDPGMANTSEGEEPGSLRLRYRPSEDDLRRLRVPEAYTVAAMSGANDNLYFNFNGITLESPQQEPLPKKITFDGNLAIDPFEVEVCSFLLDPECNALLKATNLASVSATLEVNSGWSEEVDISLPQIPIPLPWIPLGEDFLVTPVAFVGFDFAGTLEAGMKASMVAQATFEMGTEILPLPKGFGAEPTAVVQVGAPSLASALGTPKLLIDLKPKVETVFVAWAIIEGVPVPIAAPYLEGESSSVLEIEVLGDPWWHSTGDLTVDLGVYLHNGSKNHIEGLHDVQLPTITAPGPLPVITDTLTSRWSKAYDNGGQGEAGTVVVKAPGGGLFVAGNAYGIGNRQLAMELDKGGDVRWAREAENSLHQSRPAAAVATSDGGYAVVGRRLTTTGSFLSRYDGDGNHLWTRNYEVAGQLGTLESILETPDGGLLVAGGRNGNAWLMRTGPTGSTIWSREFVAPEGKQSFLSEIRFGDGGETLAVGRVRYDDDAAGLRFNNALLMRLDFWGTLLEAWAIGNTAHGSAVALAVAKDGDVVIGGTTAGEANSSWLARFDLDMGGELEWSRTFGGQDIDIDDQPSGGSSPWDSVRSIEKTAGGFVVSAKNKLGDAQDAQLFKVNGGGNVVWFKSFRGPLVDELHDVEVLPTGGIAATGYHVLPAAGGGTTQDLWTVRASVDGMLHFEDDVPITVHNDKPKQSHTLLVSSVAIAMGELDSLVGDDEVPLVMVDSLAQGTELTKF